MESIAWKECELMHVQTDFDSYTLDPSLMLSIREVGMLTPTSLQRAAFAPLLEGRDLALQASSGTGRTMAWCLPMIQRLIGVGQEARSVVVVPDNEAALSVEREVSRLTRHSNLRMLMPAAGVESTGASYDMFEGDGSWPNILVGRAPSLRHFVDGTRFRMDRLAVFVVSLTKPLHPDDREAFDDLSRRLSASCQRIAVTEDADVLQALLETGFLRGPAMVFGTAPSGEPLALEPLAEPRPARAQVQEEPRPAARGGSARTRRTRRAAPTDRPESWPIAHIGVTSPGPVTAETIARLVRVEAAGHTVVLVSREDHAPEVATAIADLMGDRPVRLLHEGDEIGEDENDSVTVAHVVACKDRRLTANVLVLERFPGGADGYLSLIPMMRCDPGDRILSFVTPRDVGSQYQLRLGTGIRLLERRLPTDDEILTSDASDEVKSLRQMATGVVQKDLDLLARVGTLDDGDRILATALRRLLDLTMRPEPAQTPRGPAQPPRDERRRRRERSHETVDAGSGPRTSQKDPVEDEPLIRSFVPALPERGAGRRGGVPMVEIALGCGRDAGVKADYVAQWLQSRLAMRVSELGPIDVQDDSTVVTVPRERADEVVRILSDMSFGECRPEARILDAQERRRP